MSNCQGFHYKPGTREIEQLNGLVQDLRKWLFLVKFFPSKMAKVFKKSKKRKWKRKKPCCQCSLCTLQYFVLIFHFWRTKTFTWKSHLRQSCTKPFNCEDDFASPGLTIKRKLFVIFKSSLQLVCPVVKISCYSAENIDEKSELDNQSINIPGQFELLQNNQQLFLW